MEKKWPMGFFLTEFFSLKQQWMEIMMMEFYFHKLEKAMPKCRLNKDKNFSGQTGGQNLSEFSVGFFFALKQDGFPIRIIRRMSPT